MSRLLQASMIAVLALAPLPALATAQQPGATPRAPWLREHRPFERLLERRAEIGLTEQQVQQIRRIGARLEEQNQPLLARVRAAGLPEDRQTIRELTPEQRRALRGRMEELRPTLRQLRENHRTALQEVRGVLTEEQRSKLRETVRARREERGPGMRGRRGPDGPRGRGTRPGNGAR